MNKSQPMRKPCPLMAAALGLLFQPVGLLYVRRPLWAGIYFVLGVVIVAVDILLRNYVSFQPLRYFSLYWLLMIASAVHAYRAAERSDSSQKGCWYCRWYALLLAVAVQSAVVVFAMLVFLYHSVRMPEFSPEQLAEIADCHRAKGGPAMPLVMRDSYGSYEARIYRDECTKHGMLEVVRNGDIVFSEEGIKYYFESDPVFKMGTDITGDGMPNLVVSHWAGAAHCCLTVYVFTIGNVFELLDKIEFGHTDQIRFLRPAGSNSLLKNTPTSRNTTRHPRS